MSACKAMAATPWFYAQWAAAARIDGDEEIMPSSLRG